MTACWLQCCPQPCVVCLHSYQGLLRRETRVYRSSRLTKAQAQRQLKYVQPGEESRIGMYVATTTDESAADGLKGWQEGELGAEVKYKV